jgi:hypothetical protein
MKVKTFAAFLFNVLKQYGVEDMYNSTFWENLPAGTQEMYIDIATETIDYIKETLCE